MILQPEKTDLNQVAEILSQILQGVRISPYPPSNSIILRGSSKELEVAALVFNRLEAKQKPKPKAGGNGDPRQPKQ
jgi:hypothetical protein